MALRRRGEITLWVDAATLAAWHNRTRTRKRGRPRLYSDQAIVCILTLAAVFSLPLRAAQGFAMSLLHLLGRDDLAIPNYSTLCRRRVGLKAAPGAIYCSKQPLRLVVDSTGLKVSGEGEWKVRKHGKEARKRRVWRKAHLLVDADSRC
jgi:hypothetical protein